MIQKNKDVMSHWNVAREFLIQQLKYIDKFHECLFEENYDRAYRQLLNIINLSSYYIKKKKDEIDKLKKDVVSFRSLKYKDAKRKKEFQDLHEMQNKTINAMHGIMEIIMERFGELGAHVLLKTKKGSIEESSEMS